MIAENATTKVARTETTKDSIISKATVSTVRNLVTMNQNVERRKETKNKMSQQIVQVKKRKL